MCVGEAKVAPLSRHAMQQAHIFYVLYPLYPVCSTTSIRGVGGPSSVVLLHLPCVGSKLWDSPLSLSSSSITHSHGKKDHHLSTRPPPYAHVRPLISVISCSCNLQTSLLCSGKKFPLSIIPCMQCKLEKK